MGKALSKTIVELIPGELRSYPIAAFMWSAAIVGVPLPVLLWLTGPGDSLVSAAGVYGSLEGWLAVDGARDWWPMRPPDDVDEIDFGFLQADDLTGPGVFPTGRESPPGDPSPRGGL